MNKKDLLEFIERVEEKALDSVKKRWKENIIKKENEVMSKYDKKIAMYQSSFNNFSTNLTNILTDMKEDLEISYQHSYNIQNGLINLKNIRNSIVSNSSFQGEVQKLKDLRDKELKEVEFNYKKVYIVSKGMSSSKKIAEYLEGLGFDISNLKEDEMKYLSTDIDKTKLFVCGENK